MSGRAANHGLYVAAVLIDRLLHHCHVVNIRGNSYRMRHHAELWSTLNAPAAQADEPSKQRRKTKERARRLTSHAPGG